MRNGREGTFTLRGMGARHRTRSCCVHLCIRTVQFRREVAAVAGHEFSMQPSVLGRLVLEDAAVAVTRRALGCLCSARDEWVDARRGTTVELIQHAIAILVDLVRDSIAVVVPALHGELQQAK